ncbi:MAG: glycosyltransferase [Thermoleophilaceae bacterium]
MDAVLSCSHFSSIGGTQTYLLTVAEQLQRLGHGATIVAEELGEMADLARERGVDVALVADAPAACDALLTRDGVMAAQLAARYRGAPHIFVAPSEYFDFQLPPPVEHAVSAVVALNDRLQARVGTLALDVPVVRLKHPVDIRHFSPRAPLRSPPRRLLLLGNYLRGDRREMVERVCADLGIECVQIGAHAATATADPVAEINTADIVVGKARAIVEAMACGRAAYVMDVFGTDGWVTPDRYDALEADNFGGRVDCTAATPQRLAADLAAYAPEMGPANRDLAIAGHSAGRHAEALVSEWRRVGARPDASTSALREAERMGRLLARAEGDAWRMQTEATVAHECGQAMERERDEWALRARTADELLAELRATRRWRLAGALGRPLDRLRRLARR